MSLLARVPRHNAVHSIPPEPSLAWTVGPRSLHALLAHVDPCHSTHASSVWPCRAAAVRTSSTCIAWPLPPQPHATTPLGQHTPCRPTLLHRPSIPNFCHRRPLLLGRGHHHWEPLSRHRPPSRSVKSSLPPSSSHTAGHLPRPFFLLPPPSPPAVALPSFCAAPVSSDRLPLSPPPTSTPSASHLRSM